MPNRGKVVVVGSTNVDLVARVPHLPRPGESVGQAEYTRVAGGKGANQAVAAAKGGAKVRFVTCLGLDPFGEEMLHTLHKAGVDIRFVHRSDTPTGVAIIMVDQDGENAIAVAPGANYQLLPKDIDDALPAIQEADVVVLQLEIPMETVKRTIELATALEKPVILNPAPIPAAGLPDELLRNVHMLVLNETEAERITGQIIFGGQELPVVATRLRKLGVANVVLTLGAKGCYVASADYEGFIPAFTVKAVDTTGAGDCFSGYLAAAIANGRPLAEALQIASAAGALSVTRVGAQPSIPQLNEVEEFIGEQ